MPATYEPIATQTLSTTAASVTFSSISGSYTDLILVTNPLSTLAAASAVQFNSDTGSNYSNTVIYGDGSTAASYRRTSATQINDINARNADAMAIVHIMNYSNTTTYKSVLFRSNTLAGSELNATAALWRSTSAITTITLFTPGTTFKSGATFTLYGIAAA
jgi:hypothetical protein